MKKKLFTIAIALCMIFTMIPGGVFQAETAWAEVGAGPYNVKVNGATYYENGALESIQATFDWAGALPDAALVLMKNELNGGKDQGYGDFSDCGTYGHMFSDHEKAKAYDDANNGIFGFINNSAPQKMSYKDNTVTFELKSTDVPLSIDSYYYVYIWTLYGGYYYPDHIVCAISVKDGQVLYAAADGEGRNTYDSSKLAAIESKQAYNVTVTPGAHMTKTAESGAETQDGLTTGMTPVVYTAKEGYHFPEAYTVETVNGIMVRRDSATQITVYGTPSNNAEITLADATQGNPPAENTAVKPTAKTGLKYDGEEKTGVEAGAGYTLEGTAKATNAGDYEVTAKLSTGYKWDDNTTADVKLNWSIAPAGTVRVTVNDMNAYVGDEVPAPTFIIGTLCAGDKLGGQAVFKYQLKNADGTYGEKLNAPDMSKAGTYKVTVSGLTVSNNYAGIKFGEGTLTIREKPDSGGGHSYTHRPTIIADEGADTLLTFNGTKLSITAKDGYELSDVLLNGISQGTVTELTGLKTGDKVEITTVKKEEPAADDNAKIIEGIGNTSIVLKSQLTKNGNVLLTWTKSKGYKVDYFEFYRSVKRYSGYGTKAFFTTADGSWSKYLNNKELKAGNTYYYKVRGVRVIDGQKYYTQWSNKAWRTIK